MKKVVAMLIGGLFVLVLSSTAFAGQRNYGCGLGTLVFGETDALLSQTLAGTTNGSFCSQWFGITSGTLNCNKYKSISSNEKINKFVADNMDNLAVDIARGQGEYLNTLVVLMDVSESDRTALYSKLQSNFKNIYTSDDVTSIDVVKNIEFVVKS